MIYFMRIGPTGPIKIGVTSGSPISRLKAIQHSCPYEVTLVGVVEGDVTKERELHQKFAADRLRGEWFEPAPELVQFIDEHATSYGGHAASPGLCRYSLVLPVELHAQLLDRAQRDKRSLNSYLVLQLEKLVAEEKRNG